MEQQPADNSPAVEPVVAPYESSLEGPNLLVTSEVPIAKKSRLSLIRYNKLAFTVTAAGIAIIALVGLISLVLLTVHRGSNTNSDQSAGQKSNNYAVSSLSVGEVQADQSLQVSEADHLNINGQLRVSDTVILDPGSAPDNPTAGQIYYDETSNAPYYYDGSQFISLAPTPMPEHVTAIGGVSGIISVGDGLQVTTGQLALSPTLINTINRLETAAGVTSVQGQTGAVTFTAGGGIAISGTTITNSGVVSLSSSSANVVVSHDASGNYTLSDSSVVNTGPTNAIALITGASTIGGSILSQSGAVINDSGSLNVTGAITAASFNSATISGGSLSNTSVNGLGVSSSAVSSTGNLSISAGANSLTFTDGGRDFTFPADAGNQTICTQTSGCGATGAVTSVNSITGAVTLQGTANQVGVANAGQTITLNLPQDIATTSTPTFGGATLNGGLQVTAGGATVAGGLNVSSGATSLGGTLGVTGLATLSGGLTVSSGGASITGATSINGNTSVTGSNTFTTGSGTVTLGSLGTGIVQSNNLGVLSSGVVNRNDASLLSGTLSVSNGGTGAVTLAADGVLYGNGTSAVQVTSAAANSILATGVGSVPVLTQFLPAAVQGNITTTGALSSGSIANGFGTIATANSISTTAALQGGSLSIAAGNFTVDASGNVVTKGTITVQGVGGLTLGVAGVSGTTGSLIFANTSNSHLTTLQGLAPAGQSQTITIPATNAVSGNDTVCLLSLANCAGAGSGVTATGYNQNYVTKFNGTTDQITVSQIFDNGTSVGIGTASPNASYLLDVNGSINTSGNLNQTGTGTFTSGTGAVTLKGATSITGTNTLTVGTGATSLGGTLGVTGLATLSGGLTVSAGSTSLGATTITGTANINTAGGAATSIGTSGANFSLQSSAFTVTTGGALSGISTIAATGAITAATSGNTINNLVINSGALSGVTGITTNGAYTQTGASANTLTGATTIQSTLDVQGASAKIGTAGTTTGSLILANSGNATQRALLQAQSVSGGSGDATYQLPTAAGGSTYTICVSGINCGAAANTVNTSSSGTAGTIPVFTGANTIANSDITDDGTTVSVGVTLAASTISASTLQSSGALSITPGGNLTVGANNQVLALLGSASSTFKVTASGKTTTVGFVTPTSNRTINFPDESGTICLQNSTNCGFATSGSGVTSVDTLVGALTINNSSGVGTAITIDNASTTAKGIAEFNSSDFSVASGIVDTIQAITTTSVVQFGGLGLGVAGSSGNLTLAATGKVIANTLTHTGTGHDIMLDAGANNITFSNSSGANTFVFPTTGGTGQVICTSGITCASGGGQAVILEPSGVQTANTNATSVFIDKQSGSGNLIELQATDQDAFVIDNTGNTHILNIATIDNLHTNSITPTAALTVGATNQSFTIQGDFSSGLVVNDGTNDTNLGFAVKSGFSSQTGSIYYAFEADNNITPNTSGTPYFVCTTVGNCAGVGGGVTTDGSATPGTIAFFTTSNNIESSLLAQASNTVTVSGNLDVGTSSNGNLLIGAAGSTNASLGFKFNNGTADKTITIQGPSTLSSLTSNTTLNLPTSSGTFAVAATGPLSLDATTGTLSCSTCLTGGGGGSGGVTGITGTHSGSVAISGSLTINNALTSGSSITLDNAKADGSTKGIAAFNSTNFQDNGSGVINTAQDIATSSSPTFANLTVQGLSGLTIGSTSNDGKLSFLDGTNDGFSQTFNQATITGANKTITIPNASGTLVVAAGTNLSLSNGTLSTVANPSFSTSVTTPQLNGSGGLTINPNGNLTAGTTSNQFTLQGTATSTITATGGGFTTTVGFTTPTAARAINFPDAGGTICTDSGNCLGGSSGAANAHLSNLTSVAINTSLLPGTAGAVDLGGATLPFGQLYIAGTSSTPATNNFLITGASTGGTRTITLPDATGTVCLNNSASCGFEATTGTDFIKNSTSQFSENINLQAPSGVAVKIQGASGQDIADFYSSASSSTPVASIDSSGNLTAASLTSNGNLSASGTVTFSGLTDGLVQTVSGVLSGGTVNRNSSSFFNTLLSVANGGTGAASFTNKGILYGNGAGALQVTSSLASAVLITDPSTSVPSLSQTLPTAVQGNITTTGALSSGSIASGFGTISTSNSIMTSVLLQSGSLKVGSSTQFQVDTSGNVSTSGTISSTNSSGLALGVASTTAGQILLHTTGAGDVTINSLAQAGALAISVPADTHGTDQFCLVTLANCSPTAGSFIENQTAQQTNANFNIAAVAGTVAATIQGGGVSNDILDLVGSGGGAPVASFDNSGNLTAAGGTFNSGLTETGAVSLNASGSTTTSIGTGSNSGTIGIGNGSSGVITVQSGHAINLTAGAASTISTGANTLTVTSSNFNVTAGGLINSQTISSAANFTGSLTIQGSGGETIGVVGSTTGKLTLASSHAGGSFSLQADTGQLNATTLDLPVDGNANDTLCLVTLANCGSASGNGNYLQNTTTVQTAANEYIRSASGTSVVAQIEGANGQTANLLNLNTYNGTSSTTVASFSTSGSETLAGTLNLTGAGSFPGSPTAGEVFYNTANNQLYVYNGTYWQGSLSTATEIVAANNSTNKQSANFVASGTNDQNTINSAISALPSTGGSVVLLDGTYNLSGAVTLNKGNTLLTGQGTNTILKRLYDESGSTAGLITVSANDERISKLYIDGNKASFSNVNNNGIYLASGSGTDVSLSSLSIINSAGIGFDNAQGVSSNINISSSIITGSTGDGVYYNQSSGSITNNTICSNNNGINLSNSSNVVMNGNTICSNSASGVISGNSNNVYSNNVVRSNTSWGLQLSMRSSVTGNNVNNNGGGGIALAAGNTYSNIIGNNVNNNTGDGIDINAGGAAGNDTVSGNVIAANTGNGILLGNNAKNNVISSNQIYDNGGSGSSSGITLNNANASNNQLISNQISDTAGTGFAISISAGVPGTYLSNNTYSGTGASSIQDLGTGTIYANQVDSSGNIILKATGSTKVNTASASTVGLVIQGTSSQTADLQDFADSNSNVLSKFDANGNFSGLGTNLTLGALAVPTGVTSSTSPGSSFFYKVTALNAQGETTASSEVNGTAAATTVSWTAVPGATSYRVYRGTSTGAEAGYIPVTAPTVSVANAQSASLTGSSAPPTSTAGTGLSLQGWNGQTGNLLSLKDSAGNINAAFNATGNQLTLGRVASSGTVTQGQLVLSDGTTSNKSLTLQVSNGSTSLSNNITIQFPANDTNSSDTVCLQTLANCSSSGGVSNYINNNSGSLATEQTSANYFIQGIASSVTAKLQGATGGGDIIDLYPSSGTTSPALAVSAAGNLTFGQASTISITSATTGTQLTVQGGAATGGTNVGGNLLLQGGAGASTGASGSVIVQSNTNNSTTAFQIQNSSGASGALLTGDTSNMRLGVNVTYSQMGLPTSVSAVACSSSCPSGTLTNGSTYKYKVTAIDSLGGETTVSATEGSVAATATQVINVSWTGATGASGYRIYRTAANGASGSETLYAYSTASSYVDTGAGPAPGTAQPGSNTAYISTNVSNASGQLSIGGNGTPTGQVYVSGTVPSGITGQVALGNDPLGLSVSGSYAYIASLNSGTFQVIDISNPASPVAVSSVSTGAGPVAVQGHYAYIADSATYSLQVVNITNPAAPVVTQSFVGDATASNLASNIYVSGRYAYVVNGSNTLQIIDISNPASPAAVSVIGVVTGPQNVFVQGRYAYVTGNNTLQIIDISNPASPSIAGSASANIGPNGIFVQGRYAYVVCGNNSLKIFDVSNPTSPALVGSLASPNASYVYVQGRYAYLATTAGVKTVDVSNPATPALVGTSGGGLATTPNGISVQGRYVYYLDKTNNMLDIFDIGGEYAQQLQAGGIETGTLQVDTNAQVVGDTNIQGGLSVGQSIQTAGNLGVAGGATIQGSTVLAGGANQLSSPTQNAVTFTGSTGGSGVTWTYVVTAVNAYGGETLASGSQSIVAPGASNSTLTGSNFNVVHWNAVAGATSYKIYRTAATGGTPSTTGLIGTSTGTSFNDTGLAGAGNSSPSINTSAQLTVEGSTLIQTTSNTATAFQVQNASGAAALTVDTTNQRVDVGSNGTATGQLYISGSLPTSSVGTTNTGRAIVVQGRYEYLTSGNVLDIYDVSNPASPTLIGTYNAGTTMKGVYVLGKYAYVTESASGKLDVVDVSNPNTPTSVAQFTTATADPWYIFAQGRYAYVVSNGSGADSLQIIDISNPLNPQSVSNTALGSTIGAGVFAQGRYVYVGINTGGGGSDFETFDVSNPASPTNATIALTGATGGVSDLYVQGRYAYVVDASSGKLFVVDVSTSTPSLVTNLSLTHSSDSYVFAQGRYAYAYSSTGGTVDVVDISNPASPANVGSITGVGSGVASGARELFVAGRYLYAGSGNIMDLGGTYSQQLEAGGAEVGTLNVDSNASFAGNAGVQGSLAVGQTLAVNGNIGASGQFLLQSSANSSQAFQVQNSSAVTLLGVDTNANTVNVGNTLANGTASTVNIATSTNGVATVNIGSAVGASAVSIAAGSGNLALAATSGNITLTTNTSGSIIAKSGANTTTAFQVQNATSTPLLTGDTTNMRLGVNVTYTAMSAISGTPTISVPAQNATPSVTPTGGTGGTSYSYRIVAVKSTGNSAASNSGSTASGVASLNSTTYNALSWTAFGGATSYLIYRVTPAAQAGLIGTATTNSFNDTGMTAGGAGTVPAAQGSLAASSTYMYKVTAIDAAGGETTASTEVSATTGTTTETIDLSWTSVTGAVGYKIYRTAAGGASNSENYLTTVNTNVFTDIGVMSTTALSPPGSSNAYYASNNSTNNNLQLTLGGNGTPTGQVYVGGTLPTTPISIYSQSNAVNNVFVVGSYAYLNGYQGAFKVVDVSNPAAPQEVGSLTLSGGTQGGGLYVQGRYAYVANFSGSLQIVDISNPSSPTLTSTLTTGAGTNSVYVQGRYAYVTNNTASTMQIVDVSNPASPVIVSTTSTNSGPNTIYVLGRYAYVGTTTSGILQIFDIANPSSPVQTASLTLTNRITSLYVQGRYAYVGDFNGFLKIIDVSNPYSPVLTGSVASGIRYTTMMVQGRYVYVTGDISTSVDVIDVSNPTAPFKVGSIAITGNGLIDGLYAQGRYLYVGNQNGNVKLEIFDMGGEYAQQLQAGGAEFGTLTVDSNAQFNGGASFAGGISTGDSIQTAANLGIGGNAFVQGTTSLAGGILGGLTINGLSTPATPTVTTQGSTGAQTWGYEVVAVSASGGTSPASAQGTTTSANGVSTLTGTNFQQISWSPVAGAVSYKVYRTQVAATSPNPSTTGLIGTTTSTTLNDTGLAGDSSTAPSVDTSGKLTVNGFISLLGGQTADITTASAGSSNAITIKPGDSTASSGTGAGLTLKAGDQTGTTCSASNCTGGSITLQGGSATGASGTSRNGGNVSIDAGSGNTSNGTINIGTNVQAAAINIGNTSNTNGINIKQSVTVSADKGIELQYTSGNSSAFKVDVSGGQLLTADTSANQVSVGNTGGCTTPTHGKLCINQAISNSTGTIANLNNTETITGTSNNVTNYVNVAEIADTSSGSGNTIQGFYLDASGTTNASTTVNSYYSKVTASQTGSFLQFVNGANTVLTVSNSGNTTFQAAASSATAFTVQNTSSKAVLTADTSGNQVLLGSANNLDGKLVVAAAAGGTVTIDATGITSGNSYGLHLPTSAPSGSGQCLTTTSTTQLAFGNCYGAHTKAINLAAEYAGAVLATCSTTGGGACGGSDTNTGTMTSGWDNSATNSGMNYYNWTSTQSNAQTYDVIVRVPVPSDWSSWTGTNLSLSYYDDGNSNAALSAQVIGSNNSFDVGSSGSMSSVTLGTASQWNTATFSLTNADYSGGGVFTIRLRVSEKSSGNIRLGLITLNYNSSY